MTIEEQTDTTNALVELNAPTIVLTASEMYIDADSVSLNADSNIYLDANTDITLNASTDITLDANTDISLNADSNISLNADSNISLNADSNIYLYAHTDISLYADSNIYLYASTDISITGDSGVYIATPKLILNGALELWAIDSATLYATTPYDGTIRYCSDCTSNGITGKLVMRLGSMWRRLAFE